MNSPYTFGSTTPSQRVTASLQVLNDAPGRLRQLRTGYQDAVQEARRTVSHDPDLSAEGRQKQLRDRTAATGATWKAKLDELRDEIVSAESAIDTAVEASWPKPASGVEAMLTRQAAWARSRALLDTTASGSRSIAGRLDELISETTNVETLHALREELPTWARVQGMSTDNADTVEMVVDRQIAKVTKGSDVDLTAKLNAKALIASLNPMLDQADAEMAGNSTPAAGMRAAIASHSARTMAMRTQLANGSDDPLGMKERPTSLRSAFSNHADKPAGR